MNKSFERPVFESEVRYEHLLQYVLVAYMYNIYIKFQDLRNIQIGSMKQAYKEPKKRDPKDKEQYVTIDKSKHDKNLMDQDEYDDDVSVTSEVSSISSYDSDMSDMSSESEYSEIEEG